VYLENKAKKGKPERGDRVAVMALIVQRREKKESKTKGKKKPCQYSRSYEKMRG